MYIILLCRMRKTQLGRNNIMISIIVVCGVRKNTFKTNVMIHNINQYDLSKNIIRRHVQLI